MRGPTSDPYPRLLAQWQAQREVVESYHRALSHLMLDSGIPVERCRALRQELNAKLASALLALRQASEQLGRAEQRRALASGRW